jgi:glutathione S-transferase
MYDFYYSTGTCARACLVFLEELKVPYNGHCISLKNGDGQKPEYLKLNPMGQVPCLVEGSFNLSENIAIIQYLASQHPGSALYPVEAQDKAKCNQWLSYLCSTVHPSFWGTFFVGKWSADGQASTREWSSTQVAKCFDKIEQQLAQTKFLCGDTCTMADVMMTVLAGWCKYLSNPTQLGPNVTRVVNHVQGLPCWQAAMAIEKAEDQKSQAA